MTVADLTVALRKDIGQGEDSGRWKGITRRTVNELLKPFEPQGITHKLVQIPLTLVQIGPQFAPPSPDEEGNCREAADDPV